MKYKPIWAHRYVKFVALPTFAVIPLALVGSTASAQEVQDPSSLAGHAEAPSQIFISGRRTIQKITIGEGREKIEVSLGGGDCEPPGSGISDLWAQVVTDDSNLDAVQAETCPAFRAAISKLWSTRPHHTRQPNPMRSVRAGPFVIADSRDLFELDSARGRRAAALWIQQMLTAVQPCWNNFREDRTRNVVPRLYSKLAMTPR